MKPTLTKITSVIILLVFFNMQSRAQKDTTEFEIGNKKLIVVNKRIQKENAIYNLEKGKEAFEKEIAEANKKIAEQEKLLAIVEKDLQLLKDSMDSNASMRESVTRNTYILKISRKDTISGKPGADMESGLHKQKKLSPEQQKKFFEQQKNILEKQKLEFKNKKAEITNLKATIEINKKKKNAFENGIKEIEMGISEIEDGLVEIDEELKNISSNNGKYKTSFDKNIKKRFNAHWSGFEFGLLNFVNKNQSFISDEDVSFMKIIPEKTFSYGLNIFELNIPFTKYSFGLGTGAGLKWSSISLEKKISLVENSNGEIMGEPINTNIEKLKKNKLNVAYIRIPVILEYQTPIKSRKIYFGLGLFGEIRGWSKQKQKYVIEGVTYKDKVVDNFQLSPFTYGLSARAGYGDIGIFIEYTLVPLFKNGKGPEMYPVMIGLRLLDF